MKDIEPTGCNKLAHLNMRVLGWIGDKILSVYGSHTCGNEEEETTIVREKVKRHGKDDEYIIDDGNMFPASNPAFYEDNDENLARK